jgi:hypothetical protein
VIKEIATDWRFNGLRWATYRLPSGHIERVLQQEWVREVTKPVPGCQEAHMAFESRWEDVPNHEMLFR